MDVVAKNDYAARVDDVGQAAQAVELGGDVAADIPSIEGFGQTVNCMRCATASQFGIPKRAGSIAEICLATDYFTLCWLMHGRFALTSPLSYVLRDQCKNA